MRRLFAALSLVFVLCSTVSGQSYVYRRPIVAGGGSTLKDSNSATQNAVRYLGYNNVIRVGSWFQAGSSYTLTSFKIVPSKTGTGGDCTMTGTIYASGPGSLLGTSTNTHPASDFDGSTEIEWTFSGVSITESSYYYIVIECPGTCGTSSNRPNFYYADTGSRSIKYYISSWQTEDSSADFTFKTYGY